MNDSELSGDEWLVLFVSFFLGVGPGVRYYVSIRHLGTLRWPSRACRWLLFLVPAAGLLGLWLLLAFWSAKEVRANYSLILLFLFLGAVWIFRGLQLFPVLGLSFREDIVEQRNSSAAIAISGAMFAVMVTFAGGNIGEGPTIWTTIFSSLLATAGLFVCWLVLEGVSCVSLAITEERDLASGWRLAGFLVAVGLILGRAVAGNWQSAFQTVQDFFHDCWPAMVLTAVAICEEHRAQPTLKSPAPSVRANGVIPAASYILFAIIALIVLGKWK